MKGDFTRDTFDLTKNFSRVLMQQGRVTLDADGNEQAAILLHYLRTLAKDLIGPYGGPVSDFGFELKVQGTPNTLHIGKGRYYVDGILVENHQERTYTTQPDYWSDLNDPLVHFLNHPDADQSFYIYLDVWERHITFIEDGDIREPALDGPDTCTRAKVVWQVKALPLKDHQYQGRLTTGCMRARVDPGKMSKDPCLVSPAAKYRGVENQLYRVEIHRGGDFYNATFKWARDNGSRVTRLLSVAGKDLVVANPRGFQGAPWVEYSNEQYDLSSTPGLLARLVSVNGTTLTIDPNSLPPGSLPTVENVKSPKLRQWDQTQKGNIQLVYGAVPVSGTADSASSPRTSGGGQSGPWIDLEDGIQVQFVQASHSEEDYWRTGDYWLIPARVASGEILWPTEPASPGQEKPKAKCVSAHGVEHHYAPLGTLSWAEKNFTISSSRCEFWPASICYPYGSGYKAIGDL
jgi:hypothetical protein